ncbi:MAG TPA: Spy/CpxP family protein refolding chaperone [Chitinophagales bacterium]|nr:Spy/CpxP family protein refolding chaperone [Chitinophagales bacterium]
MSNKTKFLYFIIAALLLMNAGTLTVMFVGKRFKPNGPRQVSEWLAKELKFNEQQHEQYKLLQDEHRRNMAPIHQYDRALHDRYFKLLQGGSTDSVLVKQLADSIAFNRAQTELATFYNFKKVRSICNAEQQQKFDEIIGDALRMMAPHHPDKRPPR